MPHLEFWEWFGLQLIVGLTCALLWELLFAEFFRKAQTKKSVTN